MLKIVSIQFSTAERWAVATTVFGVFHHVDHILRVDHSGWPFTPNVSPFTFSLLVYPVIASIFLLREKKWYRVFATGFIFVFLLYAHTILEIPIDQYHVWAYNESLFSFTLGQPNLLNLKSPLLGIVAVTISLALAISVLVTLIYFVKEASAGKRSSEEGTT